MSWIVHFGEMGILLPKAIKSDISQICTNELIKIFMCYHSDISVKQNNLHVMNPVFVMIIVIFLKYINPSCLQILF
jgi:hypothetical protein